MTIPSISSINMATAHYFLEYIIFRITFFLRSRGNNKLSSLRYDRFLSRFMYYKRKRMKLHASVYLLSECYLNHCFSLQDFSFRRLPEGYSKLQQQQQAINKVLGRQVRQKVHHTPSLHYFIDIMPIVCCCCFIIHCR